MKRFQKMFTSGVLASSLALLFFSGATSGCQQRNEGPVEKLGREIDDTVSDLGEKKKTGTEKAGEKLRELGDDIEDNS